MADGTGQALFRAKKPERRARLSKVAGAADTIRGFGHETDITFGLTLGQFSLLDLIEAALGITGSAHVLISTWSTGFYDLQRAVRFAADGRMLSVRFIMDSSDKRGQAKGTDVADVFGPESIRTTRTHAKFVVIHNDDWHVVIQSSMNLNLNPRSEHFSMTDDRATAEFILALADALWAELPSGATYDRTTPGFAGVAAVQPTLGIEVGRVVDVGRVSVAVEAR